MSFREKKRTLRINLCFRGQIKYLKHISKLTNKVHDFMKVPNVYLGLGQPENSTETQSQFFSTIVQK